MLIALAIGASVSGCGASALQGQATGVTLALHVIDAPDMRCNGEVADVTALQQSLEAVPEAPVKRLARSVPARQRR